MKNVNVKEVQDYASDLFHKGFACSEAVMYTINKFLDLGLDEKTFSMCSGFPWGLGGGGCICGALAGSSMILSSKYGRQSFDKTRDEKCFKINNELHDEFKKLNGATCCRVLCKGLPKDSDERKANCDTYVRNAIKIVIDLFNKYE